MTNTKTTRFPEAEYKKTGLPEYDENPLIAALPAIMSPIQVAKSLRKRPHFQPEEINLPCHILYTDRSVPIVFKPCIPRLSKMDLGIHELPPVVAGAVAKLLSIVLIFA